MVDREHENTAAIGVPVSGAVKPDAEWLRVLFFVDLLRIRHSVVLSPTRGRWSAPGRRGQFLNLLFFHRKMLQVVGFRGMYVVRFWIMLPRCKWR